MRISDWSSDVCSSDLGLIDNILDLAISDAGALELDIQPVEVKALVDAAVAAKADMLAEKQLDLNVRVRANAGRIECDERRLSASLHHLLSNSINFTPSGGRVMVLAEGR